MAIDINECSAPILCVCDDCGARFYDDEDHTPRQCLKALGIRPERDEESIRFERLYDEEG